MKPLLIVSLCTAILGGCSSPPANSGDRGGNYVNPPSFNKVELKGNRFIDGVVYILNSPPDKTNSDFSLGAGNQENTKNLLTAYYEPLSEVLRKRSPVDDAKTAFIAGDRYFFTRSTGELFKATRANLYGGVTQDVLTACPGKAQLEGVNFADKHGCQGVKACDDYMLTSEQYRQEWNVAMAKLCKKN